MQTLQTLIDSASEVCGSDAALARALGISRQAVSKMRKGEMPISPALAGEMAMIAHKDPLRAVTAAACEDLQKTERGRKVWEEIQRGFLALVVAIFGFSATDGYAHGSLSRDELTPVKLTDPTSYLRRLISLARATWQRVLRHIAVRCTTQRTAPGATTTPTGRCVPWRLALAMTKNA